MSHWVACKFRRTLANCPMVFRVTEGTTTAWIFEIAWVNALFVFAESIVRAIFVNGTLTGM